MTRLLLAALLALTACGQPPAVPAVDTSVVAPTPVRAPAVAQRAVVVGQPLPEATEAASAAVQEPVAAILAAVEEATPDLAVQTPPPDARDAACRRSAASLIIRWEITSPALYARALRYPVWPGGSSGVTWGVGYDGGVQTARGIADDWSDHAARERLATTAGLTGSRAKAVLPRYRDIDTAYDYAARVFENRTLIEYENRSGRAFRDGFAALPSNACAALVSLVYNRGAAMTGDNRREMRAIRDDCVPKGDVACIARQIRAMKRLWRGTVNERGLSARRESEAILAETP